MPDKKHDGFGWLKAKTEKPMAGRHGVVAEPDFRIAYLLDFASFSVIRM